MLLSDRSLPGARVGPFLPIGVEVGRRLGKRSWIGGFVSVIDLGALLDYRVKQSTTAAMDAPGEAAATVAPAPQIGLAQVFSPGVFATVGLGRSPLSLGVGGSFTPELRSVAGGEPKPEALTAFRFGAFLAVDIPLLFIR